VVSDPYEKAKRIIFNADITISASDRVLNLQQNIDPIRDALSAFQRPGDWHHLSTLLNFLHEEQDYAFLPLETLEKHKEICNALETNRNEINEEYTRLNYERAIKLLRKSTDPSFKFNKHTDRERLLERAIRLIWGRFSPDYTWPYSSVSRSDACALIAQCYLERSILALPKGSSVPEKKLEALHKAWKWAEKIGDGLNRLMLDILLELYRWDKNLSRDWVIEQLKTFLNANTLNPQASCDWALIDLAGELGLDCSALDKQILTVSADGFEDRKTLWLPLYHANAALRLHCNSVVSEHLSNAVDKLKNVPFSYPLWDDTVKLFERVIEQGVNSWEESAIKLWRICQDGEKLVRLSIQLRWYWSRHQRLYQLAFKAAISRDDDKKLAAEIADSQKSKPAIKMITLEKALHDDTDKEMISLLSEIDAIFSAGGFSAGYHELLDKAKELMKTIVQPKTRDIEKDVPKGWAAVHFYILDEEEGYALVFENGGWKKYRFDISGLWEKYQVWDRTRQALGVERSEQHLNELCEEMGKEETFTFLFNEISSQNIIFIPYGFLHLLPMHAARYNGEYLFQNKACLYLPAWSLPDIHDGSSASQKAISISICICLAHWPSWKETELEKMKGAGWDEWNNETTGKSLFESLDKLKAPPQLLSIICHGKGDILNPYNSCLLLKDSTVKHQELTASLPMLHGAKVFLAACESDMAPVGASPVDEHLSMSTAFLRKGACEVGGALFACTNEHSDELVLAAKERPNDPLYLIVQAKQEEWLPNENGQIHRIVPFRVLGFPSVKEVEAE